VNYLSAEWIAAADGAVKSAAASAPAEGLVIDQLVTGACNYRLVLGPHPSVHAISGSETEQADAVFSQDLATATAVAQGTTDAHQAFLLGRIRFEGNINVLIERRDAFDWLESVLAPVLAGTTFG